MPTPRKYLVSLEATPYYHCIGWCVRRAFLWGTDTFSGQNFSHRKAWVVERLAELSKVFAIDICAYAVMSNHYHLVLHVDPERVKHWSDAEIAARWGNLFVVPPILLKYLNETWHDPVELPIVMEVVDKLRQRLCDLSWFMRCLNEPLARRANLEDDCKGRFWEGRFKSQAILDEAGLLACCGYVDLNPVRAGVSDTPEASSFTSIQQRIFEFTDGIVEEFKEKLIKSKLAIQSVKISQKPEGFSHQLNQANKPQNYPILFPFSNPSTSEIDNKFPFNLKDYLELVDWVSRIVRTDCRQSLGTATPPILNRLGFTPEIFMQHMKKQAMQKGTVIGSLESMKNFSDVVHQKFAKRISMPDIVFSESF